MKKYWKKSLLWILAVSLLLGRAITVRALWDGATVYNDAEYLGHPWEGIASIDFIKVFQLEEGESSVLPVVSFTGKKWNGPLYTYTPLIQEKEANFSVPVPYRMTSEDGKMTGRCWLMARPAGSVLDWTEAERQELLNLAPDILACRDRMIAVLEKLQERVDQRRVEVGGYQPAYQPMMYYLRNYSFWCFADDNEIPGYGQAEVLFTVESLQQSIKGRMRTYPNSFLKADQMKEWLGCVEAFCEEMENDRIAEPELTGFRLGDYKGVVDGTSHVTLTVPEGANLPAPGEAVVSTEGSVHANWFAGSLESGQLLYRLTPKAAWTGTLYNGTGGYAFDTDLGKTWMVEIRRGDPVLCIRSLTVALNGRVYRGRIDEETKKITLTLPEGTDVRALTPELIHTAAAATIGGRAEGTAVDLSSPREIVLKTDTYTQTYTLEAVLGPSAECDILSYEIDGQKGIIDGDRITLTLPWGTDLHAAEVKVEISEDASLTAEPRALTFDTPLTYVVRAQSGDTRTYTVTLTETGVSDENRILSFSYGSTRASIDQDEGTILLELPEGTDIRKLRPTIQVSEFAGVYPASGEAQDFSSPVKYRVTAQSGAANTYTVTVRLVAAGENPYQAQMVSLRDKIISRYRTQASDDWEWMNVGFYDRTVREPSPSSLPQGLDLRTRIAKLDTGSSVAMTDFDRTIMMLTALGIDATKLDLYAEGGPFVDKNGNEVTDLVECLYNYSGGYTINGPIFALIALDMGNYTIPENAVWTRERLLETILTHPYGTDGFGVDMVGMLMQSIAPYQDDPVYGSRVKAKLEEGIEIFLGNQKAPGVDAMQPDFTFGGFGYQSSESAAQALCALCAAGVDCHTDARFRDGQGSSALTAFLAYADGEYFAHTMDVPKNAMATYQGCYTVQWYLGFLEHGGAGHPYSLYYRQQDFSRPLSTEAEILSFELEGKPGEIEGDRITVTLPRGTPLTGMKPRLTLSDYAKLDAPDLPVTFSEGVPQPFTVRAEDGVTTRTYYVTVLLGDGLLASGSYLDPDSLKLQDARILRDLEITGRTVTEGEASTDILLRVSAGVDPTELYISGTVSYGATTEPEHVLDGKTKVNLSGWNTIRVTAEDGVSVSVYRIKVEVQESASIESFSVTIDGAVYRGVIDNAAETITITEVPSDADVTALAPDIVMGEGTNVCSPLSGVPQNFSSTVSYTVSGNGLATRVYAVDILDADGKHITGGGKDPGTEDPGTQDPGSEDPGTQDPGTKLPATVIAKFRLLGTDALIDEEKKLITVTLPEGTDLSRVAPEVTAESGCSVSPASGEVVDLSSPVVYTVTNGQAASSYTVIVTLEKSVSQQLWEKLELEQEEYQMIEEHQVVR